MHPVRIMKKLNKKWSLHNEFKVGLYHIGDEIQWTVCGLSNCLLPQQGSYPC